jgi:peptidoglycan DL-endopeptidase CwlO
MSARGHLRRHISPRKTRAIWGVVGATAISLSLVTATTAGATSLTTLKAEAAAADQHVSQLYAQSEQTEQAYVAVHTKYENTLARYRQTKEQVRVAKANLATARHQLAASLTRSYKTGKVDPVEYMLAAKSVGDLVNEVQFLNRTNASNADLVSEVAKWSTTIKHEEATQRKQTVELQQQDASSRQAHTAAVSSLDAAKAYRANLSVAIRNEMAKIQAARAAAAAAAAARAQAAQTPATTNTTTTTTSGGGVGSYHGAPPPASSLGGKAVQIAEQYLGVPYVWGGASPSGFDCSGLVMYVYAQLGVSLPHNAAAQYASLPHVPLNDLEPGDLVFFYGFGHVGIYVGGNTVIHAPHTGAVVSFENMNYMGPIAAARP